ncbi:MAG TPA: TldD/PmbA family protein [Mesotoga infera]|uniref:TldD/PmbA family protein n=1 Tax=Mesotoga infera TaxID=1236046 RepID=A0A7C1H795_9BACT|nr:TldD/PmbA family protein [Mesotoga infera]
MDFKTFVDKAFEMSRRKGFDEAQIYYARGGEFQLSSLNGEIDSYKDASSTEIYFSGLKNGKIGTAFSEVLNEESAELLVGEAFENHSVASGEDVYSFYDGSGKYPEFDGYSGAFQKKSVEEKMDTVISLERTALDYDKRILMVPTCRTADTWSEVFIVNTLGLNKHYKSDGGFAVVVSLAGDEKSKKTGFSISLVRTPDDLDVQRMGNESSRRAVEQLGAGNVKSGKYRVVFRNDVFGQLFGTFTSMYSADNVQRGLSVLKGKEGTVIGSSKLTVYDDPFLPESPYSKPFDDEGVPTYRKAMVENGKLKTFLYDLRTAAKEGKKSTGNSVRGTYRSKPSIVPVNIVIQRGEKSFDELLETMGEGILVTELTGLHSGTNQVSGEFSLGASGFYVKGGKISNPIEQFTISSNILKVYNGIAEIGSDPLSSIYRVSSPSVLIDEIDVASE